MLTVLLPDVPDPPEDPEDDFQLELEADEEGISGNDSISCRISQSGLDNEPGAESRGK
jgi:hypothetical protein